MEQPSGQDATQPLLRVYLLGDFQIVWQAPVEAKDMAWSGRTSARTLFKLLLCAPGRQASRQVLAGVLWPESDEERARESLRSACQVLRKVLNTTTGEELLEQRNNNELLRLAGQPRLWVDVDAFDELVAQATRAANSDEAFALWQQANALLRGELLADDVGVEWMSHRWVKQRKQAFWMQRSRMIRHLADHYLQRGQTGLAEELLEQHLVRFPADQDALYRLLTLLEEYGSFEQASILYEQSRRILEGVGKQPAQHVRACYERFKQSITSRPETSLAKKKLAVSEPTSQIHLVVSPSFVSNELKGQQRELIDSTHQELSLPGAKRRLDTTLDFLRILVEPQEGQESMSQLSRRQLLELGIATLITHLARLDSSRISAVEREEVARALSASIAEGWKLFLSLDNTQVIALGQAQLSLLHQAHSLLNASTLPFLYAGAYSLLGIGLHFQSRDDEALRMYHQGYIAALATGDPWYIAQNLICQADAYLTLNRPLEAMQALQEAFSRLGESDEEHRRAKSHILACQADAHMAMKAHGEASRKLEQATVYLDQQGNAEEFDYASWLQIAGKNALMAGNYEQAVEYLGEATRLTPSHWLVRQPGILIPLAMAYARMREREKSLCIAKQAASALSMLNAPMTNSFLLEYIHKDVQGHLLQGKEMQKFITEIMQRLPQLAPFIEA
ncbi:MAG TPA: BTAD domain-containing putative transcriptional regulator [Ktedonobacteraceae bacterium]|nr:BTAD domain-containing putative transcriptional regulator [Ktedonobacteraceae bacterium]